MYLSSYLSWFRRLLILGAVVAGLTASAAGARLDPGTGVSDVGSALSTSASIRGLSSATPVSRIIDQEEGRQRDLGLFSLGFSSASTTISPTWEHQLHSPFTASQYPPPAGLKADGLRYQGIARVYEQLQSDKAVRPDRPGPLGVGEPTSVPVSGGSGFAWDDWAIGVGAGIGLALLLGVGLVVGRQKRHRVQPA